MVSFKAIIAENLGTIGKANYAVKQLDAHIECAFAYSRKDRTVWFLLVDADDKSLNASELLDVAKTISKELNNLVCPTQVRPTMWGSKQQVAIKAYKFSVITD